MALAKGTQVRQIIKPLEGIVGGYQVDEETGEVQVLVQWNTPEGDVQGKYFKESEIEAV